MYHIFIHSSMEHFKRVLLTYLLFNLLSITSIHWNLTSVLLYSSRSPMVYCQFQCMVLSLYFIGFIWYHCPSPLWKAQHSVSGMAPFAGSWHISAVIYSAQLAALLGPVILLNVQVAQSSQSPAHPSYILSSAIIATVVPACFVVSSLMCLQARVFPRAADT